jgi:hypothetical protein
VFTRLSITIMILNLVNPDFYYHNVAPKAYAKFL